MRIQFLDDRQLMLLCIGNHFAVVKDQGIEFVAASSAFTSDDSCAPKSNCTKISDSDIPDDYIRCAAYDPLSHKLALVSNDKKLWIWDTDLWSLIGSRDLVKRGSAIAFLSSKIFSLLDDSRTLMMGHVSQVTDLVLTDDYLITSDTDEHIRVSNFPNAYDIHTYCLGHESFVSRLCIIDDVLVSGGGDSYICLWDYKSGTKLDSKEINNDFGVTVLTNYQKKLMIATEKSCILTFWNVEKTLNFTKELDLGYPIIDAAFDSNGYIWVSTSNGLARIVNDEISWLNIKIGTIKSFTYESVLDLKKTITENSVKPKKIKI